MKRTLLAFLLFYLLPATTLAADISPASEWPVFRGNAYSSGVSAAKLPINLEKLWRFDEEGGYHNAAPAVRDGVVYFSTADGGLFAITIATGKKLWQFKPEFGFGKCAPMVDDDHVYIGDYDGYFFAFDRKTGKVVWKIEAESAFDTSPNFFTTDTGETVVVFVTTEGITYVVAAKTGKVLRKIETVDDSATEMACGVTIAGGCAFIAGCDKILHTIDLQTGKEKASVDIGGPTLCTPAVYKEKTQYVAYLGTIEGDFLAIGFSPDFSQGRVLWKYNSELPGAHEFRSSAAVTEKFVLVGNHDKHVHCLNRTTGKLAWAFKTGKRVLASPVIVQSRVYVPSTDGRLYVLDLATGKKLAEFEITGKLEGSPAVVDGKILQGDSDGGLWCLGKK